MIVKTSTFKMDISSYDKLYNLLQEFCKSENVTGDEFIENKLIIESLTLTEEEIEKFVLLITHKSFLEAVKNNVVEHYNLRNYKDIRIMMIIFIVVFACDQNANKLFELLKDVKCAFKNKLLQYFWNEDNLVQMALTGCRFFEDDYVLSQIIHPLLNKKDLLQIVDELLYKDKVSKRTPKAVTVPQLLTVAQRKKPTPIVPLNTPVEMVTFQFQEVPKTLYQPDKIEKRLMGEFEKNKLKAQKLLARAKALNKNYCKPRQQAVHVEVPPSLFKAKRAPKITKNVGIKGNVATTLREASRCVKDQEEQIKQIEAMMQGSSTLDKYRELENTVRQLEEQKSFEEIERKHLEGLLTFEEAILAKRKLLDCNKERFKQFMREREIFLQHIQDWKNAEEERIKQTVKKTQEIERNAKYSEKRHKEEIKSQVSQFKKQTKRMLQEAYEKQQDELAKKAKLIEEIRTLHHLKSLHPAKEFDPTECPNLGLLCQMSIADLQSKLLQMKLEMEQQLEKKRRCIQNHREKQRRMIENVKNFITQARMSKPKRTVPIRPTKLVQSVELDKLRGQLEKAREKRRKDVKVEGVACPSVQRYLEEY